MKERTSTTLLEIIRNLLSCISMDRVDCLPVNSLEVLLFKVYSKLLDKEYAESVIISLNVAQSIEEDMKLFEDSIQKNYSCSNLKSAISYLVNELVCNVEQHSGVDIGLGLSYFNASNNSLYIGVADGGISIYGSYVKAQRYFPNNEGEALFMAQNGYSTKNLPNAENRGYGISSNSKLIVDGLGGSFSILSGNALFYNSANGKIIFELPKNLVWPGTLVLVEIPLSEQDINIYDYIG